MKAVTDAEYERGVRMNLDDPKTWDDLDWYDELDDEELAKIAAENASR